jgi:hypothetical protein
MDKGAKNFSPLREIGCVDSFSTNRFRPKGLKEMRANRWSWQITAWRSLATCRDNARWQMCNLSEVDIFCGGGCVFYQTIHAAGMKERKGEMDKRAKDFSPQHGKTGDVATMRLFRRGTDCGPLS